MQEAANAVQRRARALLEAITDTTAGDYTPIADRVLVKRLDEDTVEERESGLVVVQSEKEAKTGRALVVAAGPGRVRKGRRIAPEVAPGDVIVTGKYIGHPVELDGVEYALVKEGDVLAVIEGV